MEESTNKGYGKRPMWQWIVLYLIIAVVLYGAFYYFFLAKNGGYNYNNQGSGYVTPTTSQSSPAAAQTGDLLMTKTDATKGDYLADSKGMTLYIFDKDTTNVSNCYNDCATAWPPYLQGANTATTLPANVTLVKRTDGSMQYAYKGMPLYYYVKDQKVGDTTGDGVGGIWHLIKP